MLKKLSKAILACNKMTKGTIAYSKTAVLLTFGYSTQFLCQETDEAAGEMFNAILSLSVDGHVILSIVFALLLCFF